MNKIYFIDDQEQLLSKNNTKKFTDSNFYPNFQNELQKFRDLIVNFINNNESKTIIHFGDGDYFFLKQIPNGSACPGKRALKKNYNQLDIKPFKEGFCKCDLISVEIFEQINRKRFKELYPQNNIDVITEFIYGCVSSKWFFKQFSGKIGLLGADIKLDLIKQLVEKEEYKEYLGTDFNDYIKIPQKFACDNLEQIISDVKVQLEKSSDKTKIFLCGVGHVKSGLFHNFTKFKNAVFIDIGSGIDAIAGIIDKERPYMKNWINYRLKNYNYKNIDFLGNNIKIDKLLD
jgi:hypothetical protein